MKLSKARQINKSRELGVLLGSTLMQRRILYSCLAVMNPVVPHLVGMSNKEIWEWILDNGREANDLRTYHIDIEDFSKVWGIKGRSVADKLQLAVGSDESKSTIMNLTFKHKSKDNTKLTYINVVSSAEVDTLNGVVTVKFTDSIMPYLINLSSYTTIPLKATVGFNCNYSFSMLEHLLKRYTKSGDYPSHDIPLETLHQILGTDSVKSYERWTNFKQRVLDAIEKDFSLIAGGGYEISFEPVYGASKGRGRRSVEAVTVHFSNKGLKRFQNAVSAKKAGLDYFTENNDEALLPNNTAEEVRQKRAELSGKKPKSKPPVVVDEDGFLF